MDGLIVHRLIPNSLSCCPRSTTLNRINNIMLYGRSPIYRAAADCWPYISAEPGRKHINRIPKYLSMLTTYNRREKVAQPLLPTIKKAIDTHFQLSISTRRLPLDSRTAEMEPLVDVCAIPYRTCHFFLTGCGKAQSLDPNGAFPLDGVNIDSLTNEALETAPLLHALSGTRVAWLSKI